MNTSWIYVLMTIVMLSCSGTKWDVEAPTAPTPSEWLKGETVFNNNCARCHGARGTGTGSGPSFLIRIYEPSHHGDQAFHLAVRKGVRAHHWKLGNMRPYPQVSEKDVNEIVGYIRWLQKEAGVF